MDQNPEVTSALKGLLSVLVQLYFPWEPTLMKAGQAGVLGKIYFKLEQGSGAWGVCTACGCTGKQRQSSQKTKQNRKQNRWSDDWEGIRGRFWGDFNI